MYKIDFRHPINVHFIGIGGISMSGLAEVLLKEHFIVSGSDSQESKLTKRLESLGAAVSNGQRASNIPKDAQLVVYTAAIKADNPELAEAMLRKIPILSRAELLGQVMDNYLRSIGVAGTHGKTTTTSMIADILMAANTDPTISVGGILKSIDGNIHVGSSDIFLTEACEYTNSFLHFTPKYAVILNVEEDHMDFFENLEQIRSSFHEYAKKVPANGAIIINGGIKNHEEITSGCLGEVITYGLDPSYDFYAKDIRFHAQGGAKFTLMHRANALGPVALKVPGMHNVSNALAAAALAVTMGISYQSIARGLNSFGGAARRFEYKGNVGGVTIIDDYAHHPTEIAATLEAATTYPHKRIICVFQPHTYTRTHAFLADFANALAVADIVVLSDIYAAREKNAIGITSKDLLAELQKVQEPEKASYFFSSFEEIETFLLNNCREGDLVITMGAGDIYQVGEHLLGAS